MRGCLLQMKQSYAPSPEDNILVVCNCQHTMADFDTIYEERDEAENLPECPVITVPNPIIIRGAGNVTM